MGDNVFGRYSVAIVTPFVDHKVDAAQPVDEVGLECMITHVGSKLADLRMSHDLIGGIIVSGTTGEQHTLSPDERASLYRLSVKLAKKLEVPVIAGVAATTVASATSLAKAAVDAGCEGIMLGLPPYCRLCDEEIKTYVLAVRAVVPAANFPILLYNNVLRNGYGPSLPLLAELCREGVIWGIKLAVAPDEFMSQSLQLLQLHNKMRLYTGSDKLAGDVLSTAADRCILPRFYGLTSIAGNLYPEAVGEVVSSLSSTNAETVELGEAAHKRLVPVLDAMLLGVSLPAGLKLAMRLRGIQAGFTRQPVGYVSEAKVAEISAALEKYEASGRETGETHAVNGSV
jgi:4-hydroxy-tetrahydrodipicolinate synthase